MPQPEASECDSSSCCAQIQRKTLALRNDLRTIRQNIQAVSERRKALTRALAEDEARVQQWIQDALFDRVLGVLSDDDEVDPDSTPMPPERMAEAFENRDEDLE